MSEARDEVPGRPDWNWRLRPETLASMVGCPVTMNGQRVGVVAEAQQEGDGVTVTVELEPVMQLRVWQRAGLSMFSIEGAE